MSKDTFDDIFKSKLENHSLPMEGSQVWSKIDSQLPSNSLISAGIVSKILFFGFGLAVLVGSILYISNNQDSSINDTNLETELTLQKIKENNSENLNEINNQDINNKQVSIENHKQIKPVTGASIKSKSNSKEDDNATSNLSSDAYLKSEPKEVTIANPSSVTSNPPSKTKHIEKAYAAGETIRLRFEFQNISGFPTKSVESWIEFPDWVDVNSVKTVDHKSGLDVKTSIKHKFNTVVWTAKGDFGSDLSKMNSKGYIEYSCVITEAKTEKDIASIKPLMK